MWAALINRDPLHVGWNSFSDSIPLRDVLCRKAQDENSYFSRWFPKLPSVFTAPFYSFADARLLIIYL